MLSLAASSTALQSFMQPPPSPGGRRVGFLSGAADNRPPPPQWFLHKRTLPPNWRVCCTDLAISRVLAGLSSELPSGRGKVTGSPAPPAAHAAEGWTKVSVLRSTGPQAKLLMYDFGVQYSQPVYL